MSPRLVTVGVLLAVVSGCANPNTQRAVGISMISVGLGTPLIQTAVTGYAVKDISNAGKSWEAVGVGWGVGAALAILGAIITALAEPGHATTSAGYWVRESRCDSDLCERCPNWETETLCSDGGQHACRAVPGKKPSCAGQASPASPVYRGEGFWVRADQCKNQRCRRCPNWATIKECRQGRYQCVRIEGDRVPCVAPPRDPDDSPRSAPATAPR
jgi:hypothetical protein